MDRGDAALQHLLEHTQRTFNSEVRLPRDLHIRLVGDATADRLGISGPTYMPKDHTVYFPREFVDGARADLRRYGHPLADGDPADELEDATQFALYHQLTHGLVDLLDVPIVGGEERAADSLAAIFAIRTQRGGQVIPLSVAGLQRAEARREGAPGLLQYADDHELDAEREFDSLCLLYGSDQKRYRSFVGPDP